MSLSIVIPARNEQFLPNTVADMLRNSEADTEIIVVLDAAWPAPPGLEQHPKVKVVFTPTVIGQRAATNLGVRLSHARYVMKADAHVAFGPGFDRILIESAQELGPDVTQIPQQRNLHVFDWVCETCTFRKYQGPTPKACASCKGTAWRQEIIWRPRNSTRTHGWRFDTDLHFQYWPAFHNRPENKGLEIYDVMTSLGACFFMERDRFWALDGLDEGHGGWGQMGVEVALKSWLSGGRHVVNRRTWFAHLFRTQKGFGFPYPLPSSEQDYARKYSQNLWRGNLWPKQVRPLSWLIEKFAPIPTWHDADGAGALELVMSAGTAFSPRDEGSMSLDGNALKVGGIGAGSADSVSSAGVGVEHDGSERMAVDAVRSPGLSGAHAGPSQEIVPRDDSSDVARVAAQLVVAPVVDDQGLCREGLRQRSVEPCDQDAMDVRLGAARSASREADSRIPCSGVDVASPQPAVRSGVDGDLGKDAGELLSVEMGNREILGVSHASASSADVGSGPDRCDQHLSGPSIVRRQTRGIVYYSDCRPAADILEASRRTIEASDMPIVAVTLVPIMWRSARNIVLPLERGYLTMFRQILAGLEALDTDIVFFCEHDVLYSRDHFQFEPPRRDVVYYNLAVWKVDHETGRALHYRTKQTSGICAYRDILVEHYRKRVEIVERTGFSRKMGFEPGSHGRAERVDDLTSDVWWSEVPNIDIRHARNLTSSRWSPAEFRDKRNCEGWTEGDDVPGWGRTRGRFKEMLLDICVGHREMAIAQ